MIKSFILILGSLILFAVPIFGQTTRDLKLISTSPVGFIRNGVAMEPKFDSDGNICRLTLKSEADQGKKRIDGNNILAGEAVEEIIDLLFPEQIRGKKTETWGKIYILDFMTEYRYDKIRIIAFDGNKRPKSNFPNLVKNNNSIKSAAAFVINFVDKNCN